MRIRLILPVLAAMSMLTLGACNKTTDSNSNATPGASSIAPAADTSGPSSPVPNAPNSSSSVSGPSSSNSGVAANGTGGSSAGGNAGNPPPAPSNASQATPPTPAAVPVAPIVLRAGTPLVVSVDQEVSTKTNSSGDRFVASLAEPVTVDGKVVLPRGSRITGTVTEADSAGHVKGSAMLALTLDSITVHGDKYSLATSSYTEQGKGRGKRTGIGAGGGAAFGAIVGALAGGGKGAAIGAVAGGGAGTAGTALTGNRDLTIPAETRLHFRLRRSLTIPQ
jgi:hypothetical protein